MSRFRRVEVARAGPTALGILVPPGIRSPVVLRPSALSWDLLPARWDGDPKTAPALCDFPRDEAPTIARKLLQALEAAIAAQTSPLETFGKAPAFQLWARAAGFFWIACQRVAGQAYRPLVFPTREEAEAAGAKLEPYLWPSPSVTQEVYFNTQKFGKGQNSPDQ